jgi:hypothetical protein
VAIGALIYAIRRIEHWRKTFGLLLSEREQPASETSYSGPVGPWFSAEARARRRFTTAAGERLDPAFALRRWAGAEKIRDLLGRQAGARHPTPAASRSIRPFA